MQIFVCSKNKAHNMVKTHRATHVLSINDVGGRLFLSPRLQEIKKKGNFLHMEFEDDLEVTALGPKIHHVQRIIDWASKLPKDAIVVIHCWAGVSRSTAAALAILTMQWGDPWIAAARLKVIRPEACPNVLISMMADDILKMDGELLAASESIVKEKLFFITGN